MEHLAVLQTLGLTAPTYKHQVQMLPHMTEGCVGVFVNNSAVRAEGQLLPLPTDVDGLSCEALLVVEVCQ